MVEDRYDWANGVKLEDHTKRKHKILRDYFSRYLSVRCKIPQQQRFRLAVVDGFAGGGRYSGGESGSPIIFIEELQNAINAVNVQRVTQGMGTLEIECLFIFNDADSDAIELLKSSVAPHLAEVKENAPKLHLEVKYLSKPFEAAYLEIRQFLLLGRYRSVLFNLDQYGHSDVERNTLLDIMRTYPSPEIFYTFSIGAFLAFLRKSEPALLAAQLGHVGLSDKDLQSLQGGFSKNIWLGAAERLVFEAFKNCAAYVSPFSINNPEGWRYWLIHFANSYRARQVYNNVLHHNSSDQAHFGRSGLNMLYFDPEHEKGALYLFDVSGREVARKELIEDIPRLISESGDVMGVGDFYESIYNMTPAHADDVHSAIIENLDLEVITEVGGERRKASTIMIADTIKLKRQISFFPMFTRTKNSQ